MEVGHNRLSLKNQPVLSNPVLQALAENAQGLRGLRDVVAAVVQGLGDKPPLREHLEDLEELIRYHLESTAYQFVQGIIRVEPGVGLGDNLPLIAVHQALKGFPGKVDRSGSGGVGRPKYCGSFRKKPFAGWGAARICTWMCG